MGQSNKGFRRIIVNESPYRWKTISYDTYYESKTLKVEIRPEEVPSNFSGQLHVNWYNYIDNAMGLEELEELSIKPGDICNLIEFAKSEKKWNEKDPIRISFESKRDCFDFDVFVQGKLKCQSEC